MKYFMCEICKVYGSEFLYDDRKNYSRKGDFYPGMAVEVDGLNGTMNMNRLVL